MQTRKIKQQSLNNENISFNLHGDVVQSGQYRRLQFIWKNESQDDDIIKAIAADLCKKLQRAEIRVQIPTPPFIFLDFLI